MPIEIKCVLDTSRLMAIAAQIPGGVDTALDKVANDTLALAVQSMEGEGHGMTYGTHVASAPGEPPAVDMGHLKGSGFIRKGRGIRIVGFSAEYAAHLEFGTVKMSARPFLLPAFVRAGKGLIAAIVVVFEGGRVKIVSGDQ